MRKLWYKIRRKIAWVTFRAAFFGTAGQRANKGIAVVGFLIGFLASIVWGTIERQRWLDAHCVVIGKVSGSTGFGYTSAGDGGVVTTYTPGKTGYKCDDGLEYWE